jgi:hypothetical protein
MKTKKIILTKQMAVNIPGIYLTEYNKYIDIDIITENEDAESRFRFVSYSISISDEEMSEKFMTSNIRRSIKSEEDIASLITYCKKEVDIDYLKTILEKAKEHHEKLSENILNIFK